MELDEYRKLAEVEDRMWYFRALNRRVVHALWRGGFARTAPWRVLDAGCGTGGLVNDLQAAFPRTEVTGLDYSARACALARQRTGVEIVQGSITALPFADQRFDVVTSVDVVCQVEDAALALREIARVTRPGGLVVVNAPAFRALWSYHDDTCQTKHRFHRAELAELFVRAGLGVEFASYANLPALPLIWARRRWFQPAQPTSDVRLYPAPVEAMFAAMAALEFEWMDAGIASPVGSSVWIVGRKPRA